MKDLLVSDWMQTTVVTAGPEFGMLKAHQLMRENNIRRLPVVNKRGQLIGIVTRSDIRRAEPSEATTLNVWEMNYLLAQLQLRQIMSKDVVTGRADDTIKTAAMHLQRYKIGALPIIDDKRKVIGIITESDIFRVLIAWFNEEIEGIA